MSRITVILLNWARPKNIPIIIDCLKRQTARPAIFLWDNANSRELMHSPIDWVVKSSKNVACPARWFMAAMANTDYILVHDDDLCVLNNNTLAQLTDFMDRQEPRTAAGAFGVKLVRGKSYIECEHVASGSRDVRVDIVKGRLMCVRTADLRTIPTCSDQQDDLYISAKLRKRTFGHSNSIDLPHWVPSLFADRIAELPKGKFSLETESTHYIKREEARRAFYD